MTTPADQLAEWLAKIERLHPQEIELGLTRIQVVVARLALSSFNCPVITVVGTNGKGTCCKALEAIYQRAGYQVGCYTSPHLLRFNERICMNGQSVADADLCQAFEQIERARGQTELTFFEFTTLAALVIFQSQSLDCVILEAGLGGRLDAVNCVDADLVVLTNVGLDHQAWLGETREQIGAEKVAVLRSGMPLVVVDERPVPVSVLQHAQAMASSVSYYQHDFELELAASVNSMLAKPSLAAAQQVVRLLAQRLPVAAAQVEQALAELQLPGRCQVVSQPVLTWLDVAHNPDGCQRLAKLLTTSPVKGRTIAVFAMAADKSIAESLQSVSSAIDTWYITELGVARSARAQQIAEILTGMGAPATCTQDAAQAYRDAAASAGPNDRIVVFGSFYLVATVLAVIQAL